MNDIDTARAEDRGRPFGFEAFEDTSDRPFLGDEETVDLIVRAFVLDVIEARRAWNADEIGETEATRRIGKSVERYAAVFMGRDDAYQSQPWNSAEQVGRYILSHLDCGGPEDEAVEALLWATARDVVAAMVAGEDGSVDEDGQKMNVEAAIEFARLLLLGLPIENE